MLSEKHDICSLFIQVVFFCVLFSSCTPDEFYIRGFNIQITSPDNPQPPQATGVSLKLVYPEDFLTEIAGSQALGTLSILDVRTGKEYARMLLQPAPTTRSVGVQLPAGEYAFLVWVDYRTAPHLSYYDTADLEQVTPAQPQGEGIKEAYAACACLEVKEGQLQEVNLPLYTPVAHYRFVLDESPEDYVGNTVLVQQVGYYPIVYNVRTGECTSSVIHPKWMNKARVQADGKVCLFEGMQFVHAARSATSIFNLFLGNEQGHLLYERNGVVLHLSAGERTNEVMGLEDFWQYTEGSIIDGDFSGDIDIEIK